MREIQSMSAFPYFSDNIPGENKPEPLTSLNTGLSVTRGTNNNGDLYRYYCFSPIHRTNKSKRNQPPHAPSPVDSSMANQGKRSRVLLESSNHHQNLMMPQQMDPFSHSNGLDVHQQHHFDMDHKMPHMTTASGMASVQQFGAHTYKTMNSHSSAWNDRFQELLKYKSEHLDCLVPQRYPKNPQLGVWVNKQRAEYKLLKEGKKSSMTEERIRTLESVGFVWAKRRKGQPTWDLKFEELTMYKHKHGDCLVPTKYTENPALGRWVSTQRAQYKLMKEDKPSTMTEERVIALEKIGFVWRLQF